MTDYYTPTSEYGTKRYQEPQMTMEPEMMYRQHPHHHHMGHHMGGMNGYKYNFNGFSVDGKEILKRGLKYLFEGLAVAFVAYYFTHGKLDLTDIIKLGVTAAFVFAILDTFSPTISLGARFGAGFGVGQTMFGLNPTVLATPVGAVI